MQEFNNTHADDVYNRAIIKLYKAAIAAGLRAEAEEAKQTSKDAAPTTKPAATSSSEGFEITLSANQSPQ